MKEIIQKTYEFAKNYHSNDNSGHDFEHIKRVYNNVCSLLKKYPQADEFTVKMAALLHDIDDRKLGSDGKQAQKFMKSINLVESQITKILSVINSISFSTTGSNPDFDTLEQAILFDADKLDAMGAIGICRTIMYGTHVKAKLFDTQIFPQENISKEEYKNMQRADNTTINHFFDKLLKLKNIMQTEEGKKAAQKRHDFMVSFLTEFFEEHNNKEWLSFLINYLKKHHLN